MNRFVVISFIAVGVLAAGTVFGQHDSPLFPHQKEILALYKDGKYSEAEQHLLNVITGNATPLEKVGAFSIMVSSRKHNPQAGIATIDAAYKVIQPLYSQVPQNAQYTIGHYPVDRAVWQGDFAQAAKAAQQLRKELESKTDRVFMVYSEEPALLYRSGKKKEALKIVSDTWLKYPNNYVRNEAVRLKLAEYIADMKDEDTAFALLDELREGFPTEFRSNQYAVENWLNYAVRAQLGDNENEKRKKLLDIAEYGQSVVALKNYERVRDAIHYCLGELFERAKDISSAKKSYKSAIKNSGEGEFGNNIRMWSQSAIKRLDQPVPNQAVKTPKNVRSRSLQRHSSNWDVFIISITVLVILIVIFVVRLRRKMAR